MQRKNVNQLTHFPSPLAGEGARRAGEGYIKGNTYLIPLIGFECLRTQNHFPRQGGSQTASGFTLIELLVVVLIIGILAAVALPQYQKAVTKSRYAAIKNLVQSMYDAEQAYYLANGQYTEDFDNLSIDVSGRHGNMLHARYPLPNTVCELGTQYVYCKNSKIDLAYARFYSGGRYCVFYNENSLAQQICKQDTNRTAPSFGDWYPYP